MQFRELELFRARLQQEIPDILKACDPEDQESLTIFLDRLSRNVSRAAFLRAREIFSQPWKAEWVPNPDIEDTRTTELATYSTILDGKIKEETKIALYQIYYALHAKRNTQGPCWNKEIPRLMINQSFQPGNSTNEQNNTIIIIPLVQPDIIEGLKKEIVARSGRKMLD